MSLGELRLKCECLRCKLGKRGGARHELSPSLIRGIRNAFLAVLVEAQQVIIALQVDPELMCGAECLHAPVRHSGAYGSLAMDDLADGGLWGMYGLGEPAASGASY